MRGTAITQRCSAAVEQQSMRTKMTPSHSHCNITSHRIASPLHTHTRAHTISPTTAWQQYARIPHKAVCTAAARLPCMTRYKQRTHKGSSSGTGRVHPSNHPLFNSKLHHIAMCCVRGRGEVCAVQCSKCHAHHFENGTSARRSDCRGRSHAVQKTMHNVTAVQEGSKAHTHSPTRPHPPHDDTHTALTA